MTKLYFQFDSSVINDNNYIFYLTYFNKDELEEDEKHFIKNNINRDSSEDKLKDLIEWMNSVSKKVRHKVSNEV